jgi:peptidoglycan hydrolase CwlO-like protein
MSEKPATKPKVLRVGKKEKKVGKPSEVSSAVQPPPAPVPSKKGAKTKKKEKDAEHRGPTGTAAPPPPDSSDDSAIDQPPPSKQKKTKKKVKHDEAASKAAKHGRSVLIVDNARELQSFRAQHVWGAVNMMEYLVGVEKQVGALMKDEVDVKKYTSHAKASAGLQIALGTTALSLGIVLCFVTAGAAVPILVGAGVAAGWSSAGASAYGDVARGMRRNKEGVSNKERVEAKAAEASALIDLDTGYGVLKGAVKIVKIGQIGASEYAMNSDSGKKAFTASGAKMGTTAAGKTTVMTLIETGGAGTATLATVGFGMSAFGGAVSLGLGSRNLYKEVKYDSRVVYMASRGELRQHVRTLQMFVARLQDQEYSDFLTDFSAYCSLDSLVDRVKALSKKLLKLDKKIDGKSIEDMTVLLKKSEAKAKSANKNVKKAQKEVEAKKAKCTEAEAAFEEAKAKKADLEKKVKKLLGAATPDEGKIKELGKKVLKASQKVGALNTKIETAKENLEEAKKSVEEAEKEEEQRWEEVEETKDEGIREQLGIDQGPGQKLTRVRAVARVER